MQSFKQKVLPMDTQDDLTIIYKEKGNKLHEIKTSQNDFLHALRYFQPQINEINKTKVIFIQEDISIDIFKSFISSISTKEIEINDDNYNDFYNLSHKYEYIELKTQIQEFIIKRPDLFHIIEDISQKTQVKVNDHVKEEIISKNLDVVLQNGFLKTIPIDPLIRILSSPKRVLKNHHLLFSFIIEKLISNSKYPNNDERDKFLILPSFLDYCQMTNDEIETLIKVECLSPFISPSKAEERMMIFISNEKKKYYKKIKNLKKK